MRARLFPGCLRVLAASTLLASMLVLGACMSGTKLQPPTAGIQQVTVNSDGSLVVVVRFQNYSYDTGMHVYAIDANLSLNDKPAGKITFSPALDIPAMDADIATETFKPDTGAVATLAATDHNAVQYELKGTLSVGKGSHGKSQSFKFDGKGYISPVPGVSNIWR